MSLLEKIKKLGYWEVAIRPTKFVERRVEQLSDLEKLVLNSQVRIRGWPFPVDEDGRTSRLAGHVACEVEWGNHWETWRLYQSGLFVWYKANRWDLMAQETGSGGSRPIQAGKVLSVGDALYLFSEIFEFASRLALSAAGDEKMRIEVECHGIQGRHLSVEVWHDTPGRKCQAPSWSLARDYSRAQLAADARNLALAAAAELFQLFGWDVRTAVLAGILEQR